MGKSYLKNTECKISRKKKRGNLSKNNIKTSKQEKHMIKQFKRIKRNELKNPSNW